MATSSASSFTWTLSKAFLSFASVCATFTGIWWCGTQYDNETPRKYFDKDRNYAMLPFDMLDAQNVCEAKTQTRYGTSLVRTMVDYHSTRYEAKSGLYKVFLTAHLGSAQIYDEAVVYCFVNPNQYMVEHYRTFMKTEKSLMERAWAMISF